jgi:NitT/TauT family transport system substrate-binding protein
MRQFFVIVCAILLVSVSGCNTDGANKKINLRLKWVKQAQFAGYIVADKKGFYKGQGLNVEILPAGPDIKSFMTVANGSDQFGIAMPNQIIAARSNGVPLTIIGQIMQNSPYRYVLKSQNKIDSLPQLKGKTIGLWLKADESEFTAMLKKQGVSLNDVKVIPQEFTVAPFLEDKYVLSAVTVYNELNQIRSQGYEGDKLQVLSPKDYGCAFLGDMIFAKEDYIRKNSDIVTKFLEASIAGWKYTIEHPDEALDIVMASNPELNKEQQKKQLEAVIDLIKTGKSLTDGIGYMDESEYFNIEKILRESNQIQNAVDIKQVYSDDSWNKISKNVKQIK